MIVIVINFLIKRFPKNCNCSKHVVCYIFTSYNVNKVWVVRVLLSINIIIETIILWGWRWYCCCCCCLMAKMAKNRFKSHLNEFHECRFIHFSAWKLLNKWAYNNYFKWKSNGCCFNTRINWFIDFDKYFCRLNDAFIYSFYRQYCNTTNESTKFF